MRDSMRSVSLPEKDYLAILDLILKFNECITREDLKTAMQSLLAPLFDAQSILYGSIDPDFSNFALIDSINMSDQELNFVLDIMPYDYISTQVIERGRSVMAYDVDCPREKFEIGKDSFIASHPDYPSEKSSYFEKYKTGLVMRDPLDPNLGMGIHRHTDTPLTRREVRILELLTPHILNTIKTIVLREELSQYQSLGKILTDVPTPITLVKGNSRIVFCNKAFEKLFQLKVGQPLPEELIAVLQKEKSRYDPPFETNHSQIEIPFYKKDGEYYRLNITRLKEKNPQENELWLVRLKLAVEPYSKMNILMQEAGLTDREMEICILIHDGFENQEIADRLFISFHTVKNHFRHIYEKLGVGSRVKLMKLLNQSV